MKVRELTDRQRAEGGPLELKQAGTPEWCWQLLGVLKSWWRSGQNSNEHFYAILNLLEEHQAYKKIPPEKPFGNVDAMLEAEIGVNKKQALRLVNANERRQAAAAATDGSKLPRGGRMGDSPIQSQAERAAHVGIGVRQQRDLDKLVDVGRKDLVERVMSGELATDGAMILAGLKERRIAVSTNPYKAVATLVNNFTAEEVDAILAELQRVVSQRKQKAA
jgi:hypothetical protein